MLSLDWFDLGGTLKDAWDGGMVKAKVISCSMDFHQHRGWNKDYGELPPVDIHIPTVPEAFISDLLPLLASIKPKINYVIKSKPRADLPKDGPIGVHEFARAYRN
nr:thiamine pyrophosphate-binding protein [Dehalococcoidia bacterium]